MSVEGAGVLAALFGIPIVIGLALLAIAATVLVVTAAGTVITVAAAAHGASRAATALAKAGYRLYQDQKNTTSQPNAEVECDVSADNYAHVRSVLVARQKAEARQKRSVQRPPEFTAADRAALASQLTLATQKTALVQRKSTDEWHVPTLPQSFLNPQQSYSGKAGVGTVSTFDFRSAFKRYYEVLQLLKAKVEALAPSHALNAAIAQQIEAADTRKASAPIDTAYAKTFVESVLKLHREATEVLILEQQQSARHARIHASVENALTRIDAAQKQQTVLSPNVALYLREVTEALAEGDYASLESLVPKLNDAFGLHAQQQTDAQLQHLRAFFAQMLTDMEHFGEMVLIDSVHASSPTEVKDAQRRSDCLAWVRAYHTFMENVRLGRAGDLEAERDSLELRANHLRELSIGMAEEIHHGYVAGLLLIALTEIGYPPASNAPVKIYEPITGYQGGSSISFRLRPDGTFTFTSDGFGDATCKAIYDQVLAKMNEYGVRLSAVHHWKQSEVVNKVLAVFANMGYRVDYTEQDGNIDITATNRDGEVVETRSIDADGKEITDGGQRTTARNAANRTQQQRAGIDAQQLRIKEGDADDNR